MSSTAISSPTRQSTIAAEIGKYHIIAELARGGMGNVYLAALCGPGGFHKLLAIKELKPELAEDETFVTMFVEEARLAARLVHPNIVQLNEVSSVGEHHYMAMEYLDGRSLSRVVRRFAREGGFPVAAQLRIIADALLGLHYAHELCGFAGEPFGIVHRDISPLNVMVTFDGQVKLLDFGIAKAQDSALETRAGVLKGRIAYMAPEQALGGDVDRRADVYAAGVMLWEAAAGRRLWPHMSEVEILARVSHDERPRLRDVVPAVSPDLDAICSRAMAKDRNYRYPTAAALLEDLESHLSHRDDKMTMRQIGEAVSVMFTEERYKMNQVIEERLAQIGAGSHSGVIPTFQRQVGGTPSNDWRIGADAGPSSGRFAVAPAKEYAPAIWSDKNQRGAGALGASGEGIGGMRPSALAYSLLNKSATSHSMPPEAPDWSRKRALVASGAALILVSALIGWKLTGEAQSATIQPQHSSFPSPLLAPTPEAPAAPATATETAASPTATAAAGAAPPETARVAPKVVSHDPAPVSPRTRFVAKSVATASGAPPPAAAPEEERRPAPAGATASHPPAAPTVNCDPPYTVDSNGIEHFKKGCL